MENKYSITNISEKIKLKQENRKGLVSGIVMNGNSGKYISNASY